MSPRRGRMPRPKVFARTGGMEVMQEPTATQAPVPKPVRREAVLTAYAGAGFVPPEPQAIQPLPAGLTPAEGLTMPDIGEPGDRAVAVLSPGEAVYGCLSWIANRPQTLEVGINHDPSEVAALADEFCLANRIHRPVSKTWPKKVVIPGAAEREAVRTTPPPAREVLREEPGDRQMRLAKQREQLRGRGRSAAAPPPERFSTFEPGEEADQHGKTSSDRVAELGAGMTASPPASFSGGGAPVPFES